MIHWTKLKDLLDCIAGPKGQCFSALKWMSSASFVELLESRHVVLNRGMYHMVSDSVSVFFEGH